jgi:hypothetical protein
MSYPATNRDAQLKQAELWNLMLAKELDLFIDNLPYGFVAGSSQPLRDSFEKQVAENVVYYRRRMGMDYDAVIPAHLLDPSIHPASRKP